MLKYISLAGAAFAILLVTPPVLAEQEEEEEEGARSRDDAGNDRTRGGGQAPPPTTRSSSPPPNPTGNPTPPPPAKPPPPPPPAKPPPPLPPPFPPPPKTEAEKKPVDEQRPEEEAPAAPGWDEPTATDVQDAPQPGFAASGREKKWDGASGWLWFPRILFYPVRGALEVVNAPVRGLLWANERFALMERVTSFFFTEDKRFGIYPLLGTQAGFGFNAGGRLVWKNIFDSGIKLGLNATFGGRFRQNYQAKLTFDDALGDRVGFAVLGRFEARQQDRFFGIGNGDKVAANLVMPPIDPFMDPTAVDTRFSEDLAQVSGKLSIKLGGPFKAIATSAYLSRGFGEQSEAIDTFLGDVYDTAQVTGFNDDISYLYQELELTVDNRQSTTRFASDPIPGTGWYASGYAGWAKGIGDDEVTAFVRYGFDLQRYFRIAQNPRTIVLRVAGEGVTGDLDDVPFTDLPRLGGPTFLRGFVQDRFRDRVSLIGQAEYQWDVNHYGAGFIFADAGKVGRSWKAFDLTKYGDGFFDDVDGFLKDLRYSVGAGIQLHTPTSYIGRLFFGTDLEGSFLFNFSFNPVFDIRARTERR